MDTLIYHSRSCERCRLDLLRKPGETPIHAIEFKNIFHFPNCVTFSIKLESVFRLIWFHAIYFKQKACVLLTQFPAGNGVRSLLGTGYCCGRSTAVGTRFAFPKMRRLIARLVRPSDPSFNTSFNREWFVVRSHLLTLLHSGA